MLEREIVENYENIRDRIRRLSLSPENVPDLLVVSKYQSRENILLLHRRFSHVSFGENYVQELLAKSEKLPKTIKWHFIGTLQSNKAKTLLSIENLEVFETLDSIKTAALLNKICQDRSRPLKVMIQVKTSSEPTKGGIEVRNLMELFEYVILECRYLVFHGLMTMGNSDPLLTSNENNFELMLQLKREIMELHSTKYPDYLPFECNLSMGTSRDMETAIRNGSNQIRIGTAIFGHRERINKDVV